MNFISAGAAQGLVTRLAATLRVEVAGSFGAVGAMIEKFRAGEPCDVVILTRKQVDGLEGEGLVVAGTVADLGAVPTSVAMRSGEAVPDVSGADGLRAALLASEAIHFPDPAKATAGIHFASVLERLGIAAQVKDRLSVHPNGMTAMRALAASKGRAIGCTQATEILATPGVSLVAPLPPGFDLVTTYTAAVSARAADVARAREFVESLTGDATRGSRAKAGFVTMGSDPGV